MGLQKVRHDLATEKQQQSSFKSVHSDPSSILKIRLSAFFIIVVNILHIFYKQVPDHIYNCKLFFLILQVVFSLLWSCREGDGNRWVGQVITLQTLMCLSVFSGSSWISKYCLEFASVCLISRVLKKLILTILLVFLLLLLKGGLTEVLTLPFQKPCLYSPCVTFWKALL